MAHSTILPASYNKLKDHVNLRVGLVVYVWDLDVYSPPKSQIRNVLGVINSLVGLVHTGFAQTGFNPP